MMSARLGSTHLALAAALFVVLGCSRAPPPAYDVAPVLANRAQITAALRAVGAGLEARVILRVRVDEEGYVRDVQVVRSSGDRNLDDSAVWIGEQMRFEPARYGGRAIPALVEVPINFDVVTRVERAPKIRNVEQVTAVMVRDHGDLRGLARFRVLVGPYGWIQSINDPSGVERALVRAGRALLDELKFWPAYQEGREVGRWVFIVFEFAGSESRIRMDLS